MLFGEESHEPRRRLHLERPAALDKGAGADPQQRYSSDFGEQWAYQAAEPVAKAILNAVSKTGGAMVVVSPLRGWDWMFVGRAPWADAHGFIRSPLRGWGWRSPRGRGGL